MTAGARRPPAPGATSAPTGSGPSGSSDARTVTPTGTAPGPIWVDVGGAVVRPGLYAVRERARLAEAVAVAGGLAPDADPDRVNLAAVVADGERIILLRDVSVPRCWRGIGWWVGGGGASGAGGAPVSTSSVPAGPVDLKRPVWTFSTGPRRGPGDRRRHRRARDEHGRFGGGRAGPGAASAAKLLRPRGDPVTAGLMVGPFALPPQTPPAQAMGRRRGRAVGRGPRRRRVGAFTSGVRAGVLVVWVPWWRPCAWSPG
jgi:competence protein ComEA